MITRVWHRWVARGLLIPFTVMVTACGQSGSEPTATTTLPAVVATTLPPPATVATLPPPTLPPPTIPAPPPTIPQPPEQLDKQALRDLVAPVALYPDVVLASLLPATTFPEQVHEAAQLLGPTGAAQRLPDDRGWDGSVLALMQFPDVVRWVDTNPAWTDEMGQAVTYQQGDVLDAIQDYRRLVRDAGNLQTNQYQKVSQVRSDSDIRIEPARPDIVYVPSYDPAVATQPQPQQQAGGINPWLAFGGGAVVGALGAWALYSIFDDDDKEVHHHYHGGGRRRINRYDNYYYGGRRRPAYRDWQPRERPYRQPRRDYARPGRLEHRPNAANQNTRPLRAPVARPGETRRELRQERRQDKREQRQEQRMERRDNRQQQQGQRRELRQERQVERRGQRQERQEQRREQRDNRQEQRQERRDTRQEQRGQRREERQQRQEMRRETQQQTRAERREQRQQNQQNQGGNKKRRKGENR
jgi:hypothetical protein